MSDAMKDDGNEPATKADLRELIAASDAHFGSIDARFGTIDAQFETIDARFETIDARFGSLEARLDVHGRRFESIDGNLRRLNIGFARMEGDITEIKGNVDILLGVKEDFSQFKAGIERMTNYFESCVRKMDSQGSMMMEHEGRITKLESRTN